MILIYQDYIHNNGILFRNLTRLYGANKVNYCDAREIENGILNDVQLLVMPGGADLFFCEKLNGTPNRKIRNFVENGGAYLGLCAGAYYGANNIKWAQDTAQEITQKRALDFFEGCAVGPVGDYIEDGDVNKSWKKIVPLSLSDGRKIHIFYEGGCTFQEISEKTQIIARYADIDDQPPAIIQCKVGKGCVILSGVHIEYGAGDVSARLYAHQNASFEYEKNICESESALDIVFFKQICDRLL